MLVTQNCKSKQVCSHGHTSWLHFSRKNDVFVVPLTTRLSCFRFILGKLHSFFVVVDQEVNPPVFFAGLKPVVSICRPAGTFSPILIYYSILIFLRRVETRRQYLSSRWDFFFKSKLILSRVNSFFYLELIYPIQNSFFQE